MGTYHPDLASPPTWWHQSIQEQLEESTAVHRRLADECSAAIIAAAHLMVTTFTAQGKLLLCGNGGSAADCQHMAAELVSRLTSDFDRPALPAVALTTDTSFLTAFANDCGFERVFARQIEALARPGDLLLAISTSGRSPNIYRAVEQARALHVQTIGLFGATGSPLSNLVDVPILVPGPNTQRIQEAMLTIEHILCALVEQSLFSPPASHE